MNQVNDLRSTLEKIVHEICDEIDAVRESYRVRFMGRIKRESSLVEGWYVQVQNFDDLNVVKKLKLDHYFRYYFRMIKKQGEDLSRLEISKWTPSLGSVENYLTEFEGIYPDSVQSFKRELRSKILQSGIDL